MPTLPDLLEQFGGCRGDASLCRGGQLSQSVKGATASGIIKGGATGSTFESARRDTTPAADSALLDQPGPNPPGLPSPDAQQRHPARFTE
jgi:hypothetical protein